MAEDALRIDVWLWRARFFKTRSLAARMIDDGRVRLTRGGQQNRIDTERVDVPKGGRDLFRWELVNQMMELLFAVTGIACHADSPP